MAQFKVKKRIGRYAEIGEIVDGRLVENTRDPIFKIDFQYKSESTKSAGIPFGTYAQRNVDDLLQYIEPMDAEAEKMINDFKIGKAPTSTTLEPPKEIIDTMKKVKNTIMISQIIGIGTGISIAYYRKSKIGGYVLFGIGGGLAGFLVGLLISKRNK